VQDTASTFGPELPHSELVPPLSFLPTSAVCSAGYFSGLLHPVADHGVRHVSGPRPRDAVKPRIRRIQGLDRVPDRPRPPTSGGRGRRCSPVRLGASEEALRAASRQRRRAQYRVRSRWRYTLRSFPLTSSRSTSPWPLPSRRYAVAAAFRGSRPEGHGRWGRFGGVPDLRALLHWRVRCALLTFPPARRPMLPWASVPFQGFRLVSR
jgi:hypothetical protein